MRSFALTVLLATVAMVTAIPITPAAHGLQHRAEQMRSEGFKENEIAIRLARPMNGHEVLFRPVLQQPSKFSLHSIFHSKPSIGNQDLSGDIAPGSLEAPQMLPRAAAPNSFVDTIKALLRGEDIEQREFGYEGKELELKRPVGPRRWH